MFIIQYVAHHKGRGSEGRKAENKMWVTLRGGSKTLPASPGHGEQ